MKPRYLITTADERTWPTEQPVLFLGEWCRLYNRKTLWENLDAEVVPYHWDDRGKLYRDYQYLKGLHEELLIELAAKLNEMHGMDHSLRYWRILIGPWLGYLVQMLFDRWEMIQKAITDYSIAGVRILDTVPEQFVPNDMEKFLGLHVEDDWNQGIYGQLIEGWTTIPVEKVNLGIQSALSVVQPVLSAFRRLKRKLARGASAVLQMFVREDEAFFIASYLPIQQDFRLQCSFVQVPKLWLQIAAPRGEVDLSQRQWRLGNLDLEGFPAIVRLMIPRQIPTLYLEGYATLKILCRELSWPQKPRLIFTSNSYGSNDVFKAWAAQKVEEGAPLVVGQHGGNYGVALWGFTEDHQMAISDAWLSWGWEDRNNRKIKCAFNLKTIGHTQSWDPAGGALLVGMAMPRYSYHMYSVPVASQWLNWLEEQYRFTSELPVEIRRKLLIRLFPIDFGWCQKQRWQDRFPDVRLDEGATALPSLIAKSRIYISTYNATSYLESLSLNVPTVMFWNPIHWELRDDAIPYFNRLKEVGIFHETPESAAAKVAEVWDDVPGWWNQPAIQTARQEFCGRFAWIPKRPIKVLKKALDEVLCQRK